MLRSINPASLRAAPADNAAGHESSQSSDPAGFSSLLRQQTTQSSTSTASLQPPAPQPPQRAAVNDAPATHESAKPSDTAAAHSSAPAPAAAAKQGDADEPADAASADAAESSGATGATGANGASARGTAKGKARNSDASTRAATTDATGSADKLASGQAATATTADPSQSATTATAAAPTHAAIADWLAALQNQRAATPAADKSPTTSTTATGEALDSSHDAKKSGIAKLEDAAAKDPATSARSLIAASEHNDAAPAFATLMAEQHTAADAPISRNEATATAPIGAANLAAPATIARDASSPVVAALPTPVNAPDFAQALGLQMSMFAKDGVQQAELHLNPADMGPVSVQIVMDGTQARIDFGADLAATRSAIEAGLPELASALRDAGYTLAGGGVSQHASSRGGQQGGGSDGASGNSRRGSARGVSEESVTRVGQAARRIASRGGVDLYA